MILKIEDSLSFLQFELLSGIEGLVHGVFSRKGGISSSPFHSLNAAFGIGDLEESVRENRRRIQDALKISSLISMSQVHGSDVCLINTNRALSICDGLMTQEKDLGLMALHADCQVAIFYDPIHQALSVVHAGWRGQVQNIYKNCVQKMECHFGTKPQDLLIGISPSLGPSCSEFRHYKTEFPEEFWVFQETSLHFNLWEVSRYQLEQCGVLPHHIEIAGVCTHTQEADYFSYRRDKATGRNATVAGILQPACKLDFMP